MTIETSALKREKACVEVPLGRSDCAESSDKTEDACQRTNTIYALQKIDEIMSRHGKISV